MYFDSAWELSLLTTIIINFHMDTTFTWHLGTWFQETALNHTKNFFWMRWLLAAILLRGHHVTIRKHNKCWVNPFIYFVNTFDVCVKHYSKKFPKLKVYLLLWSTVYSPSVTRVENLWAYSITSFTWMQTQTPSVNSTLNMHAQYGTLTWQKTKGSTKVSLQSIL